MTVESLGSLFSVHDLMIKHRPQWNIELCHGLPNDCQPNHSRNPVKELLNIYALPQSNDA